MPAALGAAVAYLASSIAASFTVTGILTSLATSIVLQGLQKLIMPKPKAPTFGSTGITTQVRQPIMTRKPVYGEIRLSGGVLFISASGPKNDYIHFIVEVAPHEIEEIGEIWLNDYSIAPDHLDADGTVNTGRYSGKVRIKKHLGTASQAADTDLIADVSDWTESHKLSGIAYIYIRLQYDKNIYPTGIPNVSAWIKGKKVVDTRTSTTAYSNNLALILNDYLKDADYGMAATTAEIDTTFMNAAANVCDEMVETAAISHEISSIDLSTDIITIRLRDDRLKFLTGDRVQVTTTGGLPTGISALTNYYVIAYQRKDTVRIKLASSYANALAGTAINITGAGTGTHTITKNAEPRYSGAIQLDSANEVGDNIKDILSGMAGELVYTGGVYSLTAGAYQTPTVYFDENDLAGPISIQTKVSRRERFNSVHGVYISPLNDGQPSDYPPVSNSTYATEDGETIIRQLDFPATQRPATAQRLAKIELEKSRQEITWTADFNLSGMLVQAGDNAYFTNARMGWTDKIFKVAAWTLEVREKDGAPLPVVSMTLREIASGVYDWNNGEETTVDLAPNTTLPDAFTVTPPGAPAVTESLYSAREGAGVKAKAALSCSASIDQFVNYYQFRYKLTTASDYITLAPVTGPEDVVFDIPPGTYDFGVRCINVLGVESSWVTNTPVEIVGLSAPPSAISGLTIQAISSLAILRWTQSTDLDVLEGGQIVFRHSPETSGATWSTSVSIGEAIPGRATETTLPLKTGTYLCRPYDSSGIPGDVVSVVTKGAAVDALTPTTSLTENPTFTGAKSSVALFADPTPDVIRLSGAGLFDAIPDLDAVADLDFYGGTATSGTYDFSTYIDMTTVQNARIESHIKAYIVNTMDMIDERTALIDTWETFDGTNAGAADCTIWVAETDDNPAGSPTWSAWQRLDVGEYNARAYKFQARLTSEDSAYNIYVEELSVSVQQ